MRIDEVKEIFQKERVAGKEAEKTDGG